MRAPRCAASPAATSRSPTSATGTSIPGSSRPMRITSERHSIELPEDRPSRARVDVHRSQHPDLDGGPLPLRGAASIGGAAASRRLSTAARLGARLSRAAAAVPGIPGSSRTCCDYLQARARERDSTRPSSARRIPLRSRRSAVRPRRRGGGGLPRSSALPMARAEAVNVHPALHRRPRGRRAGRLRPLSNRSPAASRHARFFFQAETEPFSSKIASCSNASFPCALWPC